MIRFNRSAWTTVFYWHGGVIQHLVWPTSYYVAYLLCVWLLQTFFPALVVGMDHKHLQVIMSSLVFLMVFRVGQTVARHRQGALHFHCIFGVLESIVTTCCQTLSGPKRAKSKDTHMDRRRFMEFAILSKINCIRHVLAFAVSLVMHCTILDSMESQGELDDPSVHELVFCYHRLHQLLYANEMSVVDQALRISCDRIPGDDVVFRAELTRHRFDDDQLGDLLLGRKLPVTSKAGEEDVVVAPLPKVVAGFLLRSLMQPLEKPWGYPQRMLNVFVGEIQRLITEMASINSICTIPTPLPYVQLADILLITVAVFYPLSMEHDESIENKLLAPALVFFVFQGFVSLAQMMETPTGHDSTDINFMEMVHGLEVHVKHAFDLSERYADKLHQDSLRPIQAFGFSCTEDVEAESARAHSHDLRPPTPCHSDQHPEEEEPPRNFDHYFHWLPIPTLVLDDILQSHGHVDVISAANQCKSEFSFRQLLRKSLARARRPAQYEAVPADEQREAVTVARQAIQKDPNIFCHYLAFSGVHQPKTATETRDNSFNAPVNHRSSSVEAQKHDLWIRSAETLLGDHSAHQLLAAKDSEDTARSIFTFQSPPDCVRLSSSCDHLRQPLPVIERRDSQPLPSSSERRHSRHATTGHDGKRMGRQHSEKLERQQSLRPSAPRLDFEEIASASPILDLSTLPSQVSSVREVDSVPE